MIFQDVILLLAVCNLLNCQAIHPFHEEIPTTAQNLLEIPLDTNWHGWLEQDRKSRLSKTQMEKETNKSNTLIKNHWSLENHILKFDGKGHSIETRSVFRDFKLWLEWKIPPQGDLLILLRGVPGPRFWDYKKGPAETSTKGSGLVAGTVGAGVGAGTGAAGGLPGSRDSQAASKAGSKSDFKRSIST